MMDLKSGYPYFLLKNGLNEHYDTLQKDLSCEVVVLGAGVTGALVADNLATNGVQCVVIDQRAIGFGSTSASTSLLQYEIDVPLHELEEKIGVKKAEFAYKSCGHSIDKLEKLCNEIGYEKFVRCHSLYYAHAKSKVSYIHTEFKSRNKGGFDVQLLSEHDVSNQFGFSAPMAILSSQAAKLDAYDFTHRLHQYNRSKGVEIFENTEVIDIKPQSNNLILITNKGIRIRAKKIVYATGYEAVEDISKKIVNLSCTFATVSKPMENLPELFTRSLIWNTNNPYLYMRTDGKRIIIGGRDEPYFSPEKRERLMNKKVNALIKDFNKLFPDLTFESQFNWAGTFGSTKDGLPYIGSYSKIPHSYFALGFGGNGIKFSVIAAELITKLIRREIKDVPQVYSFKR